VACQQYEVYNICFLYSQRGMSAVRAGKVAPQSLTAAYVGGAVVRVFAA
jgi:hypothetical protein